MVSLRSKLIASDTRDDPANGARRRALTAAPAQIDPAMSVRESLAVIAQACVAHIASSVAYASKSDDPEGVHELRVGIRRMRAAFSIFGYALPKKARSPIAEELRVLQRRLGAAREWDVLVEETIGRVPKRLREPAGALIKMALAKRAEGHQRARAVLRDPDCSDLLVRLARWIDGHFGLGAPGGSRAGAVLAGPVAGFAAEALSDYHAKVRRLGKRIDELDTSDLHRLRIRVKKLRYATEFFGDVWPGRRTQRYLFAVKDLQRALGTLHDGIVGAGLLADLGATAGTDVASVAGPIRRWLAKCQERDRRAAVELWRCFAKRNRFW
ncbi:MAG: CHAD domain-containing protein [Xanthobacteraceae bacterium]